VDRWETYTCDQCDYRTPSGKDWTTVNDYGSDGLRRRESVTDVAASTTTTTDYLLDGQNAVRSFSSQGASKDKAWFTGPRGPECEVTGYAQTLNGVTTPASAQWYVYDGLGSVVGTISKDGVTTAMRSYDAYGQATDLLTDASGSSHKYVGGLGHPTEDQSGLIYMRARFMDPAVGRFISQDPAQNGNNWFVYADDNPVNKVDANGKDPLLAIILIGILLSALAGGLLACALSQEWTAKTFFTGFAVAAAVGACALLGPGVGALAGLIIGAYMGYQNTHNAGGAIVGGLLGAAAGGIAGLFGPVEGLIAVYLIESVVLGVLLSEIDAYMEEAFK
jgi:RHS repeat-associated protein